jgi:isopenicillin N synthase-like dioxygenase
LVFRHYDPGVSDKPFGLTPHRDWGFITVLDASSDGLEAEIEGVWRPLVMEEGYLTINFGEPLNKLLPMVNASNHRVCVQKNKVRNSTVLFIDPRVGKYRPSSGLGDEEGLVWEWEPQKGQLINGQTTLRYFDQMSREMYG